MSTWPGAPTSSPSLTPGRYEGSPHWLFPGLSCRQCQFVSSLCTWSPPGWISVRSTTACCWTSREKKHVTGRISSCCRLLELHSWDILYVQLIRNSLNIITSCGNLSNWEISYEPLMSPYTEVFLPCNDARVSIEWCKSLSIFPCSVLH